MLEFLTISGILFGGGFAFGLVTGRRSWVGLPLAGAFAVIVGLCVVEWSGYRTMFARWDVFLYATVTILTYFAIATSPAVVGAFAGILIRRRFHSSHKTAHVAEPGAAPNGGPATQLGNADVSEGPPSVS
jgi:hypothetical protein